MSTFDDFMIGQHVKAHEELNQLTADRDIARKESAALALLLEQERGKVAALEAEIKEFGLWKGMLDMYKDQWKRHYEALEQTLKDEQQEWFTQHLNEESDDLRATLAALQQRCARLERALEFAIDVVPRVTYSGQLPSGHDAWVHDVMVAALAPDAGSGAAEGAAKP